MKNESEKNMISIPSEYVLQKRLVEVDAEKKRLEALIEVARLFRLIYDERNSLLDLVEKFHNKKETN